VSCEGTSFISHEQPAFSRGALRRTRHGRRGGTVAVRVGAGPALVVDDDGPGIAEGDRDRIFEPFVRADGTRAPGSGLGLALVAQQAGHHGAGVRVEDAPLGGARFTVTF
jgi:signal transduction histidine kinase